MTGLLFSTCHMKQSLFAGLLAFISLLLGIGLFVVHLGPGNTTILPGWLDELFTSCKRPDRPPPPILGITLYGWYILGMSVQLFILVAADRMRLLSHPGLGVILMMVPAYLVVLAGLDVWLHQRLDIPICAPDWIMRISAVLLMGWMLGQYAPVMRTYRQALQHLGQWILRKEPETGAGNGSAGLLLIAAMFLAVAVFQRQTIAILTTQGPELSPASSSVLLSDHLGKPEIRFAMTGDDLTLGPADAPVQMVVFSDFECPYCAELSRSVRRWHQQYGDRLQVVFKHYPLSATCNPHLQDDLHPLACQAALYSLAVARQGGFWSYHDSLFAGDLAQMDLIGVAFSQGLDPVQLANDLQDPSLVGKLSKDMEDATRGEVTETPTVFVNGRKAATANPEYLDQLLIALLSHPTGG